MITMLANTAVVARRIDSMSVYKMDSRGKRIAWARKQAGMTGSDLARATGVRNVTISYLENDHRDLSLSLLMKIAEVTGVTVGFLLMETDHPYPMKTPAEVEPVYFSPEADQAAQLIDAIHDSEERARMLAVLRALAATVSLSDKQTAKEASHLISPMSKRLIIGKHFREKSEGTRA